MSQGASGAKVSLRHYQILCGLALGAIVLLQMQMNLSPILNAVMLLVGAVTTLLPYRFSPAWVLLIVSIAHLLEQHQMNQQVNPDFRSHRFLDLNNIVLSLAVLTYTIAQYRLHAVRFGVETRHAKPRGADSLSAAELAALVVPIPLCALAAEWLALLLRQHWEFIGLPPRWKQLLTLAWVLLVVLFVAAHVFADWRRLRMPRPLALLLLCDTLWTETRGEQRRVARWIAWRKLKTMQNAERRMQN